MGDEEVRAAFVADLNRIIQKEEIYDAYRFNHVSLRSLVTESLGNTVAPERRAQINRLLLEDAFPTALSRASDRHIKYLVSTLNTFIRGSSFSALDLKQFSLRFETRRLLAVAPVGKSLSCLNRLVLEDAYPLELSRYRELPSQTLRRSQSKLNAVALSADGRLAISADKLKLRVWDLRNSRKLRTLKGHLDVVTAVSATADGRLAISGSADQTLKVWDIGTGTLLRTLHGHLGRVACVAVACDGMLAVSGGEDQALRVWKLDRGLDTLSPIGHFAAVSNLAVSVDGRLAVTWAADQMLKLWDTKTGRLRAERSCRDVIEMSFTERGDGVVLGCSDGSVRVWDSKANRKPRTLCSSVGQGEILALSSGGRWAISGSWLGYLTLWDIRRRREIQSFQIHAGMLHAAIGAEGTLVLSGSGREPLKLWRLNAGPELSTLRGHLDVTWAVAVAANGKLAVSSSTNHVLKVWDLLRGRELRTLRGHTQATRALAMSADGHLVVSGSLDRTLKVWDSHSGECLCTFTGESGMRCCGITPDAGAVIAGEQSGRVHFLRLVWPDDPVKKVSCQKRSSRKQ